MYFWKTVTRFLYNIYIFQWINLTLFISMLLIFYCKTTYKRVLAEILVIRASTRPRPLRFPYHQVALLAFWCAVTAVVILVSYLSTPPRKFYHAVISVICASAYLSGEIDLLRLAFACFSSLLVVLEVVYH